MGAPELTPEPPCDEEGKKAGAPVSRVCLVEAAEESEAEEEARGWEIVDQAVPRSPTDSCGYSPRRKRSSTIAEVPEDLIVGCLDPQCESRFGDSCRRRACTFCRLPFCSVHLTRWTLTGTAPSAASPPREPSPSAGRSPSAGSRAGSCAPEAAASLERCFGIRAEPGPAQLCRGCLAAITPSRPSPSASTQASGTDLAALVSEGQALRAMPLASLRAEAEDETPSRAAARGLLLWQLEQLRACLRPWTEHEWDWVWRLREELSDEEPEWIPQFVRQAAWADPARAGELAELLDRAHACRLLTPRGGLQVLAALGRHAAAAVAAIGARRLGSLASQAAQCLLALDEAELVCCLELLLDAGGELGAAGAVDGRQAIVGVLLQVATDGSASAAALRGELFWALEARATASTAARRLVPASPVHCAGGAAQPAEQWAWAGAALEELLSSLPPEAELGLLRQRAWVGQMERGEAEAVPADSAWGAPRAFPLAVWPPARLCLGLEGQPQQAMSRSTPTILRCRCREKGAPSPEKPSSAGPALRTETAGLLLKRDAGMHCEQQVGQTLRLLERLIWEDAGLCNLLAGEGLSLEDVRVTYVIAMTGPDTAMLEAVETAHTLRSVRASRHVAAPGATGEPPGLLAFLRQHNYGGDLPKALVRLAFTAALSAVLSFAAGLGDRHHENFMVTTDGRLLHVDYGYAFGREPLDSVLIHYAVQGGPPATTLQYRELRRALGPELLERVFWPVVRGAHLRIRRHAALLAEMAHTALVRRSRWSLLGSLAESQQSWATAQAFVSRRCKPGLSEASAGRFVCSLLRYCAQHERGARLRDELKGLRLRERTQEAVAKARDAALATGRHASVAFGQASQEATAVAREATAAAREATAAARGVAFGLLDGVRELLSEASAGREADSGPTAWY